MRYKRVVYLLVKGQSASLNVKAHATVSDGNSLVCPSPVPQAEDTGLGIVDYDVADSKPSSSFIEIQGRLC